MIPKHHKNSFDTLARAFAAEAACLVECRTTSGETVFTLCAVNRSGEEFELVPLARLFEGDPYEELTPPGPEE